MDLSLLAEVDPDRLPDEQLRPTPWAGRQVLEALLVEVRSLREDNQRLRDEINRLKGEPGTPDVKPNRRAAGRTDSSSERERRQPKAWQKGHKLDRIRIDRVERVAVERASRPADAEYRGTESVTVQDLVLRSDNVRFEKEVWSSPSLKRSYRAALPAGYDGQFGPGLKALALALHYGANLTEAKLLELFGPAGVIMSSGYLATLLGRDRVGLLAEARAVEAAGLASSPWQHLDATGTRVNGVAWHCHVLGNPLFTAYHASPAKDRLAVVDVLRGGAERSFLWNDQADA